ncbi:MAG: HDOD domain-containing protein [Comamonas sp.]
MQIAEELILPCQPRVLALLMRELLSDMPNLRRVNQLFGGDPVLAAQLMESANASAYQMQGLVRGIPQAITLLGDRQLRALLKKAQTGMTLRAKPGLDMTQFVSVSHASAKLARSLAGLTGLDASATYVAALLHAIGQIFVHQTQPERTAVMNAEVNIWDPRRPRLEMRHWGYSANSTTAALLRKWNLPADVIAAIKAMEAPMETDQFDPMAGVLHLAVWCSRVKHCGWSERSVADAFPVDVALALGVDVDVVLQQDATDWSQSLY